MEGGVKRKDKRNRKRKFEELGWKRELEEMEGGVKSNRKRKFEELDLKRVLDVNQSYPTNKPSRGQTDVALRMTKGLFLKGENNIVFSPLSLHVLLSIVAAGSAGSTLNQLLSFLRSKSADDLNSFASELISGVLRDASSSGGPHLCFANGAWVEKSLPLHHSFKQIMSTDYKASLASVDFRNKAGAVANEVNSWAASKTKGLIKNLLAPGSVNGSTRLILANALYFKGAWEEKFDARMTKDWKFHLLNGTSVKVPFMSSKNKQFISAFPGFKVLGLPYKKGKGKGRFSMYFFLPNAKDGLPSLLEKITSSSGFLESKLPHQKVEVGDFRIPKFKFSFMFEASDLLKKLRVVLPFSDAADLTKMVDSREKLYVSKIFHKAFIEINEEGTKAAAASAGVLKCKGISKPPTRVNFVADHPFIFVIREGSTGTVLFIGQVLNPRAS